MDIAAVTNQLNDLPDTFTRAGTPYTQLVDALATGLSAYTGGIDGVDAAGTSFTSAQWGWLDTWGLLLGVPRNPNEPDVFYNARIQDTLAAWVGTVPAIETWGLLQLGESVTVTEPGLPSTPGYVLDMPSGLTTAQITSFLESLSRIRPAGIPFSYLYTQGGLYLDTLNYLDAPEVYGAYLDDGTSGSAPPIPAFTVNALPLLPNYYFNDPTLNLTVV